MCLLYVVRARCAGSTRHTKYQYCRRARVASRVTTRAFLPLPTYGSALVVASRQDPDESAPDDPDAQWETALSYNITFPTNTVRM